MGCWVADALYLWLIELRKKVPEGSATARPSTTVWGDGSH